MNIGIGIALNRHNSIKQLSDFLPQMAFWSGDMDYENRKWLDQTGNTSGADLVETACIEVLADVTITPTTALTGLTVAKVNESVENITGVAVSGANIAITFASLVVTDNKIWSIELSDGQLFILQSGASPYIFAANNMGTLGGTETTDWAHSTSDSAFPYHLRDGFTKIPYTNTTHRRSIQINYPVINEKTSWSIEWEGYIFETLFTPLCTLPVGSTYYMYMSYNPETKTIQTLHREAGSKLMSYILEEDTRKLKIKVSYSGGGYGSESSWGMSINDEVVVPTYSDPMGVSDRSLYLSWGGNGLRSRALVVNNYTISVNGIDYNVIKDGIDAPYLMIDKPTGYMYLPSFDGENALGFTQSSSSAINLWNGAETKIKLPIDTTIYANDVNNMLYTDESTANAIDLNAMYPSFASKIHCNNSVGVKDFIVTTESLDLGKYIGGFNDYILYGSLRADTEGSSDVRSPLYDDIIYDENVKGDAHMFSPLFGDKWGGLISNGSMAVGLHDMAGAFYRYATYSEGVAAYNASSAGEKAAETVMETMGRIGYAATGYTPADERLQYYVDNFGFVYPEGVTPGKDDDNSVWWQWWVDQFKAHIELNGGTLDAFSELGNLLTGIHQWHPDFVSIIEDAIFGDNSGVSITDDLENDTPIFTASKNGSIVTEDGFKCNKLTGTGDNAYGIIEVGDWINDKSIDIKFDVKSSSALPLTSILAFNNSATDNISFGANISFNTATQTNPCEVGTWYTIRLILYEIYTYMSIYESGTCIYMSREYSQSTYNRFRNLRLFVLGADCFVRNYSVKSYLRNRNLEHILNIKFDNNVDYTDETTDQWIEKIKESLLFNTYAGKIAGIFSHQIKDPVTKADDGTYDGVMDRSYSAITDMVKWMKTNGFTFTNSRSLKSGNANISATRKNYAINGDFEDELMGLTGKIWGYDHLSVADGESANSVDGTNIAAIGDSFSKYVTLLSGWHYIKFYAKGYIKCDIKKKGQASSYYTSDIVSAEYKFYKLPIYIDKDNTSLSISFYDLGTSYIHKLVIE